MLAALATMEKGIVQSQEADSRATAFNTWGFEFADRIEGSARVSSLNEFAWKLMADNIPRETIEAVIKNVNSSRCKPPLSEKEIRNEVLYMFGEPGKIVIAKDGVFREEEKRPSFEIMPVSCIEEEPPEWAITNYIVKNTINVLAAPGGTGKTTVECALAAEISTGKPCFLSEDIPFTSEPGRVLFLAAEDSVKHTLRHRLEANGADCSRVIIVPTSDPHFQDIKFNSPDLRSLINQARPSLVILDPLQQYLPANVNMAYRNAMRQCLSPLFSLGEEFDCTFLIAAHCNKKETRSARAAISDSSDIWDISRSVLMMGKTEDRGILYLSHEKCNVAPLAETHLLSLEDGKVISRGKTDRRFEDFGGFWL